ncbi:mechanosensitive ion channel [Pseudodesulfovibrio thermohalotolerans]|uniref:mechanosensitive ion channel domain-containing protein n=1 Tax=Pseudodesulfovibrio thermohalotolerans TaxID=2880651 RepID=UPI0024437142|nr:mechanosensitive ion channel domain-containing protein [Pseudodesulfovibrio thermohalotolerans]WFS63419.1 mechanosensitive ion channel [Pseudodesulfovibrio thermohalotolerans]
MHQRTMYLVVVLCLFCHLAVPGFASGASPEAMLYAGSGTAAGEDSPEAGIPPDATADQLNAILASMSDEQVRRLLIEELRKNATPPAPDPGPGGVAGVIIETRQFVQKVRERFAYLFSGVTQAPRLLPETFRESLLGGDARQPGELGIGLLAVTVLWFLARWFVFRRTAGLRARIEDVEDRAPLSVKFGRLLLRGIFGLVAVSGVALITLIPYLMIFNEPDKGRPVIFVWLAAMLVVEIVRLAARFVLAPGMGSIRLLPFGDDVALYLYKWTMRIAWVVAVGILCSSLVNMARGSELVYLLIVAGTGFVVAVMTSLLALWNKPRVAEAIRRAVPPHTLRHQLAGSWHVGVIVYAMGFWFFWVVALLVFGENAMLTGVYTLLLVPTYLLVDWACRRLVGFAVGLADVPVDDEDGKSPEDGMVRIGKFQQFLSLGFRILVLAGAAFLLLKIWGVNLAFGRATVGAGLDILLTLVLAYIFWVFISGYIEKRLKAKEGQEEDHGEGEGGGGPGGDRFATLLQLVKKFIFVAISVVSVLIILSSLGVDIGPLIAGASIFGIAIGFGAQTLVKDIISGIFFLMDDAFRVGDYIIVGNATGTVEEISVRSFKLRHHLGPLYTIPFGSIKEVQNMTRDWAVMKLQYLVPFDTDLGEIKKIIKKINKEIRAIPELNEFMLSDIKSQGVKAMEEYGMRMRVKFMTKPGGQFTLRKLVLAKMRKYFAEAGIEFAKPRVSVHIPDRERLTPEEEAHVAAAASQILADEKAAKKKKK